MMDALRITKQHIGLIITFFTLPGVLFSTVFGALTDRIGRKVLLVPALLIFSAAGFACAFASDFKILLILRFIQGTCAAAMGVINLTLIGDLYHGRERTAVMGWNASVLSIGTAVYPVLGGGLALYSWHAPFFLSLLALPVAWICVTQLKRTTLNKDARIEHYLIKVLTHMKHLDIIVLNLALIVLFILIYGICLMVFPLFMEKHFSASPFVIGLYLTVMSAGTALCSWKLHFFTEKLGRTALLLWSFFFYVAACAWIPWTKHLGLLVIPCFFIGAANGLSIPTIQTLMSEKAELEYRGAFMSFASMNLRIGQTIGPLMMGLILSGNTMKLPFYVGVSMAGLMFVLIFILQAREQFLKPHK